MPSMPALRLILIVTLCLITAATAATAAPSKAMKHILHERLVGKYQVSVDGLIKVPFTAAKLASLNRRKICEIYQVPIPPNVADFPVYTILRYKKSDRFLVAISGGLAGLFDVYASPRR